MQFVHQTITDSRELARKKRQEADEMEQLARDKQAEAQNTQTQVNQDLVDLALDQGPAETAHDAAQVASKRSQKQDLENEATELQRQVDELRREADQAEQEAYEMQRQVEIAEQGGQGSDVAAGKAESAAKNSINTKEASSFL